MQLSPDGRSIVAIAHVSQGNVLVLIDADTLAATPVKGPRTQPLAVHWASNDLLAIDSLTFPYSQSVCDLLKPSGEFVRTVGARFIRTLPSADGAEQILVIRSDYPQYINRVNLRTGESLTTDFDRPGNVIRWIFNDEGLPLVATTISSAFWSDDTTITHWYRESLKAPWQALATFAVVDDYWLPAYLTRDGRSLVITSTQGRDTRAYFRYDLAERRIDEMLAGRPDQDISAGRDSADENYQVVVTEGMKPEIEWFDGHWRAVQASIDTALPRSVNAIISHSANRALVWSYSDVDPGRWYLLDVDTMRMREIAPVKPEIDPAKMRPMEIVKYRSSDGLAIPAYLTRPANASTVSRRLLSLPAAARDRWAWEPEVQMLATRGYVVFQPQFRGSSGFGKSFMKAGFGQWGLSMQDDISAGVHWLVENHVADPARICIYGASYGGYAAMWGLIKTPGLYQCGIDFAGVSDIEYMLKDDSDRNSNAFARVLQQARIGDLETGKQQFDSVSPLKRAAEITVPVLIAHGNKDVRVPIEHSEKLVAALKSAGKPYQWIELQGEGHGIVGPNNQLRFYQALFDFLDKNIGARTPGPASPRSVEPGANSARQSLSPTQ